MKKANQLVDRDIQCDERQGITFRDVTKFFMFPAFCLTMALISFFQRCFLSATEIEKLSAQSSLEWWLLIVFLWAIHKSLLEKRGESE